MHFNQLFVKQSSLLVFWLVSFSTGVVDYLTTEISTSKQKKFSLVTFVDTPGLVDGDMKYAFDVDESILWLGEFWIHADFKILTPGVLADFSDILVTCLYKSIDLFIFGKKKSTAVTCNWTKSSDMLKSSPVLFYGIEEKKITSQWPERSFMQLLKNGQRDQVLNSKVSFLFLIKW